MADNLILTDSHLILGIPEINRQKDQLFSRGSKLRPSETSNSPDNTGEKPQAKLDATTIGNALTAMMADNNIAKAHLNASGEEVGLPDGQMGNSEVGHMNIGAGRVIYQDLVKINKDISTGEIEK